MKATIKRIPKAGNGGNMLQNTIPFPNLLFSIGNPANINTNQTGTNSDSITSTVGPVDRKYATIEAEKGEVITKPDLSGIYKIAGKTHADGGTPLPAQPGSFVFSNNKKLAFNKQEMKAFEFKNGGTIDTPAKVIQREVPTKEYNFLMSIIKDPKKDNIAKDTAGLMLQKYQQKIANVAVLQEAKKNSMPPPFSQLASIPQQTDPIEANADTQYMAYGGNTLNSLDDNERYPGGRTKPGSTTPTGRQNAFNYPGGLDAYNQQWLQVAGINGAKMDNDKFQSATYDWLLGNNPDVIRNMWASYGNTAKGVKNKLGAGYDFSNLSDDQLTNLKGAYVDNNLGARSLVPQSRPTRPIDRPTIGQHTTGIGDNPSDIPLVPGQPRPPSAGTIPWQGFNFQPNAQEMLSIAAPGLQALVTPTQYDMLSQKYTPNVRLDRLDNREEVKDILSDSSLGQREAFQNAPSNVATAIAAQMQTGARRGIGQSDAQIRTGNTQIANTEEMYNAQAKASDNMFNIQNIHQTYNNNVLAKQRRAEQLINASGQVLNNANAVQSNLDNLSYAATAAALPSVTNMKDEDGNDVLVKGPDGKNYKVQGVPVDFNNRRMPVFNPNFGSLDSYLANQYANQGAGLQLNSTIMTGFEKAIQSGDINQINAYARALASLNTSRQKSSTPIENIMQALIKGQRIN